MKLLDEILTPGNPNGGGRWHATWHEVFSRCESPIEEMMADALRETATSRRIDLWPTWPDAPFDELRPNPDRPAIWVMAQRKIGRFRADFVLVMFGAFGSPILTALECDGKQFHFASIEQVKRDIARDREIEAMGYRVRRYSGSAIYRDVEGCAAETIDRMRTLWARDRDPESAEVQRLLAEMGA